MAKYVTVTTTSSFSFPYKITWKCSKCGFQNEADVDYYTSFTSSTFGSAHSGSVRSALKQKDSNTSYPVTLTTLKMFLSDFWGEPKSIYLFNGKQKYMPCSKCNNTEIWGTGKSLGEPFNPMYFLLFIIPIYYFVFGSMGWEYRGEAFLAVTALTIFLFYRWKKKADNEFEKEKEEDKNAIKEAPITSYPILVYNGHPVVSNEELERREKLRLAKNENAEPQPESSPSSGPVEMEAAKLFCRKCGKRLQGDSLFCQYCGEKVIR